MLCQRLLVACSVLCCCLVATGSASSSEYLIIRHGRSRVRHSSEKDHIRWGLQVFDNFTLLDYDVGGSGSGSGSGSARRKTGVLRPPVANSGEDEEDGGAARLTIQFNESEELERMIELSDFENLRYGMVNALRTAGPAVSDGDTTRGLSSRVATTAPPPPPTASKPRGKLIKKEIMENIRRTVDKGLEYLKSHRNLDEVKIELVPYRDRRQPRPRPVDNGRANRADREGPRQSVRPSTDLLDRRPSSSSSSSSTGVGTTPDEIDTGTSSSRVFGMQQEQQQQQQQQSLRPKARIDPVEQHFWPGPVDYPNDDTGEESPPSSPSSSSSVADVALEPSRRTTTDKLAKMEEEEEQLEEEEPPQDDDPVLQQDQGTASAEEVELELELDLGRTMDEDPDSAIGGAADAADADVNNIFHMEEADLRELDETSRNNRRNLMKGRDVVTQFLQIVESQHLLGANCTAGTALNLGEGVVDRYAQDRFRVEAEIAVNRANMLTRIFKFSSADVQASEHLLHASVLSMVEFDDDIFAGGNCFDWNQHPAKRGLFCPFAYRLPPPDQGASLVKDLALEYHYLGNTSEWFFLARKNAEKVIARNEQYIKSFHVYTNNTDRQADEILSVKYEDGRWSKPYYDCGGGNIWMLTYTVPFFGFENGTYFFKGTSGIDIDLRRVDIDQCPQKNSPSGAPQPLNIFAGTDKCKQRTTECIPIPGLGFRRGSYRCICRKGYYFPDTAIEQKYFNGSTLEEEYEKLMMNEYSTYSIPNSYECLQCAEGCDSCEDASPCVAALNWPMRTSILVLACAIIGLLPPAAVFTFKYQQVKVVRAASPALLRVIALGAFCIYCTSVVMYPPPSLYSCTARIWLREIGFSLTYGALMLKTWRISVIFRVRSAKAVKITDAYLLKRLGVLCGFVGIALVVRTLVAPPVVIVGRTADNLKAFLCKTDWWDHTFTSMEVLFLAWGVRLCIMVRKAPSEFNESRFISMAIYNEFLLTCFLNVSMLFLQSPANPDLLYIIFFCHTQLTVTLLLALIFGSKVYLVFRGGGKHQDDPTGLGIKPSGAKFISRSHGGRTFGNASSVTTSTAQLGANMGNEGRLTETEALEELKQLYVQLQRLYERIPQRGAAIVTVASLMEACRCSSLKPPPSVGAPSPLKAITAGPGMDGGAVMVLGSAGDGTSPCGVLRLDKSTNTNSTATIPNGEPCVGNGVAGGGMMLVPSHTRITITDETSTATVATVSEPLIAGAGRDSTSGARSIDGSDFRLDHQQLECMCSDSTAEPHTTNDPGDGEEAGAAASRINGTVRPAGSCCCCCDCGTVCPSQHSPPTRHRVQQQQQHNDSVINYSLSGGAAGSSSSSGGAAPATSVASAASTVNCNCKISAVSDVSGGAAARSSSSSSSSSHPPSAELVLSCQLSGGNRAGGRSAGCLSTLAHQQQQQSRRQHHRASSTASTALTTALQNLENENRSRGLALTSQQHYPTTERRSSVDAGCTETVEEQLLEGSSNPGHKDALQHTAKGASESFESSLSSSVSVAGDHHHLQQQPQQPPAPPAVNAPVTVSSPAATVPPTGTLEQPLTDGFPSGGASGSGSGSSSSNSSSASSGGSSANTLEMVGGAGPNGSPSTSATGSGSQSNAKKKKSPEKRLVIDLNDRSKYTEEVSV
ncbi:uncharacterized protein LOC125955704 [Anopheles darlingi]|uniref:uncharacterized protein LOC125955704 n=1 Tax=Anopheles darlingi TaxID=43151 RepID=UPI0021000E9B|nr:uncharacterized protein LOC125955704 [Anopheles darlingi]